MRSAEATIQQLEPPHGTVLTIPFRERAHTAWRVLFGGVLAWNDPKYLASKSSEERALRFLMALLLLQRASYLIPALATLFTASASYRNPGLNAALLFGAVAWSVFLGLTARQHGWFPKWTVWTDCGVIALLLIASTMNYVGNDVYSHQNWPTRLALATCALVAAAFAPALAAIPWTAVVAVLLIAMPLHDGSDALTASSALEVVNGCLWFAVIAHFARRYLSGQGRVLDEIQAEHVHAESQRAAHQARTHERANQYRKLHNTVLTTLTAIARGGLDHRTPEVQQRCATEAAYLRNLITEDNTAAESRLHNTLRDTITAAEALGLTIHTKQQNLPTQLPGMRCEALAQATREALNNVAKHADTNEAWLTAFADGETLTVRVVDRGKGFDPEATVYGFGLNHCIHTYMAEIGGTATIDSAPGEGTCVELVAPLQ
ncbi:hypothetical protein IEU95_01145 [Hoyosella rhizosphaerae]|uniref:Histidine kinase/HSP90-like ATPase domain-containing protein n=1 Tax=Hoyosella rhizosphaerae TaxID=1755582 RepID=A0A916ULE0_9ACTN|nr:ATP-binding protein [Hoyosella rhizosphaerae]MBN4925424.1 hypothetical protein [Hoyosella rhizosphaerae]GGC75295.1 hypothetical protein GCM10011410_30770 [Hoyosella rhizosphaerae]